MKTATFTLVYNRKKKVLKPDETSLVQFEIYFDRTRRYFSTGIYLKKNEWNEKNKRVMKRNDSDELNDYLYKKIEMLEGYRTSILNTGKQFEFEKAEEIIKGNSRKMTFLDFMEKEINERKDIEETTREQHLSTLENLKGFERIVQFSDLTYDNIKEFDNYMRSKVNEFGHKKYTDGSMATTHSRIRAYISRAVKSGYVLENPYGIFKIKQPKDDKRKYLTLDELKNIENKELSSDRLKRVRDMFIFSCYTGLAYTDAYHLSTDELLETEGEMWIKLFRDKSEGRSSVLLLPKAVEIIKKYRQFAPKGRILPYMSNQKMNSYLKELADICKVRKELTTHVARHTFATTVTLANGVPIETVSKMLGHASIKTTQIYAKILDTKIKEEMERLKSKI